MRSLFAATALALVLASSIAEARPRHLSPAPASFFSFLTRPAAMPAPRHRRYRHRAAAGAIAGRPSACRGIPWCGCWLRLHLGIGDARLNLARAWASVGTAAAPAAGVVVVWRHHVGVITENLGNGLIRVLSGNDGHAVRNRIRTTRGVIAFRRV